MHSIVEKKKTTKDVYCFPRTSTSHTLLMDLCGVGLQHEATNPTVHDLHDAPGSSRSSLDAETYVDFLCVPMWRAQCHASGHSQTGEWVHALHHSPTTLLVLHKMANI